MPDPDSKAGEHVFQRQASETDHIGIVLPGSGYTIDMPVLHYARQCLTDAGADVLSIKYSFTPTGNSTEDGRRISAILSQVETLFDIGIKQRQYKKFTIVAKSLGTVAAGHLLARKKQLKEASVVWLTPLLQYPGLIDQIKEWGGRSQFVIGTADSYYDAPLLKRVQELTNGTTVVIQNANHALEMPNDLDTTLKFIRKITKSIQKFVNND